jgi:hypothetical protein
MNFEKVDQVPNQNKEGQNKKEEIAGLDVIRVGGEEYHSGDAVIAERSDKTVENGWTLKIFGKNDVVIEKIDADPEKTLRRVITMKEFCDWQSLKEKTKEDDQ